MPTTTLRKYCVKQYRILNCLLLQILLRIQKAVLMQTTYLRVKTKLLPIVTTHRNRSIIIKEAGRTKSWLMLPITRLLCRQYSKPLRRITQLHLHHSLIRKLIEILVHLNRQDLRSPSTCNLTIHINVRIYWTILSIQDW